MYYNQDNVLDRLFLEMGEKKRREESIEAYRADVAGRQGSESDAKVPSFDPEPELTLSADNKKQNALRRMLYDLKGV